MNLTTFKERIRQNVEDVNFDFYTDTQVTAAIMEAKDDVLTLVRIFTDDFPIVQTDITFNEGEDEKTLPSNFLNLIRVESLGGGDKKYRHEVKNFRSIDEFNLGKFQDLCILFGQTNTSKVIRRRDTKQSLTITVYYQANIDDITSGSFTFGPPPTNNLIITKATIILLASKRRPVTIWQQRELKQETMLNEVLSQLNKASATFVDMRYEENY